MVIIKYKKNIMEEFDEILDDSWTKEFQEKDKPFEKFYLEDLQSIKINYIYVDTHFSITHTKVEFFFMKYPNKVSKEELICLLKKNKKYNQETYNVLSMLKYNIDLNPEQIPDFLHNTRFLATKINNFLKPINAIDDILFNKTIEMFQDLNDLYIFYYKNKNSGLEHILQTKKVIIKNIHKKSRKQKKYS
jgi:hypothetical protein